MGRNCWLEKLADDAGAESVGVCSATELGRPLRLRLAEKSLHVKELITVWVRRLLFALIHCWVNRGADCDSESAWFILEINLLHTAARENDANDDNILDRNGVGINIKLTFTFGDYGCVV